MFRRYFLTASPWQLCLLMATPYAVYKLTRFGHTPIEWGFLVLYFLAVALGWIYCVGISANERLAPEYQKSPHLFRVATVVPFVYVPLFLYLHVIPLTLGEIQRPNEGLIFLHFLTLFCAGYSVWYASKQFSTLRANRPVHFLNYYPVLMGFWFGFIGVWFLQPRIAALFADNN